MDFKTLCCILLFFASGFVGTGMAYKGERKIIGIDLGTQYTSVGVYRNGRVEIIENEQGNRVTPSCVYIGDSEVFVGEAAKNQSLLDPERTICDFKRLIGNKFDDPEVRRIQSVSSYKIVDRGGKPYIQVKRNGEVVVFSPEEMAALVVQRMKEMAEAYLGEKIKAAVVTVPGTIYYNQKKSHAVRDACETFGTNTRLIPEPYAALVAYRLNRQVDKNILVVDLGTRTLEISVLVNDYGEAEIASKTSDVNLGEENFDRKLTDYFVNSIKKKHKKDISQDKEALGKLIRESERARVELSRQSYTPVKVKSLFDGIDFSETLTSSTFEELNVDLLKKVLALVKKALDGAGLKRQDIHEIVFVGGGTRVPKLKQLLGDFFFGKKPLDSINPDEVVVHGASILGARINGDLDQTDVMNLFYVEPYSLGIETVGGVMTKLIPRDAITPRLKSIILTTYHDQQTSLPIKVYAGERALAKDCREIGSFNISGIAPAPRGVPQIKLDFYVVGDGQVHITTLDKASGKTQSVTMHSPWYDIKRERCLIKEAEKFEEEDAKIIARVEARKKLERVFNVKSLMNGDTDVYSGEIFDKENVKKAVNGVLEWLTELDKKVQDWEALLSPVMKKSCEPGRDTDEYWEFHDEL